MWLAVGGCACARAAEPTTIPSSPAAPPASAAVSPFAAATAAFPAAPVPAPASAASAPGAAAAASAFPALAAAESSSPCSRDPAGARVVMLAHRPTVLFLPNHTTRRGPCVGGLCY